MKKLVAVMIASLALASFSTSGIAQLGCRPYPNPNCPDEEARQRIEGAEKKSDAKARASAKSERGVKKTDGKARPSAKERVVKKTDGKARTVSSRTK